MNLWYICGFHLISRCCWRSNCCGGGVSVTSLIGCFYYCQMPKFGGYISAPQQLRHSLCSKILLPLWTWSIDKKWNVYYAIFVAVKLIGQWAPCHIWYSQGRGCWNTTFNMALRLCWNILKMSIEHMWPNTRNTSRPKRMLGALVLDAQLFWWLKCCFSNFNVGWIFWAFDVTNLTFMQYDISYSTFGSFLKKIFFLNFLWFFGFKKILII